MLREDSKAVVHLDLKTARSDVVLISKGRRFQSCGAKTQTARSPHRLVSVLWTQSAEIAWERQRIKSHEEEQCRETPKSKISRLPQQLTHKANCFFVKTTNNSGVEKMHFLLFYPCY